MEENLKSLELFEKVQDDGVEKMAPYLNQLWFKIIEKSLTKHYNAKLGDFGFAYLEEVAYHKDHLESHLDCWLPPLVLFYVSSNRS